MEIVLNYVHSGVNNLYFDFSNVGAGGSLVSSWSLARQFRFISFSIELVF